jgi:hypothetical protein
VALTGETNTAENILMRKPLGNLSLCMSRRRMEKHIYTYIFLRRPDCMRLDSPRVRWNAGRMSESVVKGLVLDNVWHLQLITQTELVYHARHYNCPDRTLSIANIQKKKNSPLCSFILRFLLRFLIDPSTCIFSTWFIVLAFLQNNLHFSINEYIWPYLLKFA